MRIYKYYVLVAIAITLICGCSQPDATAPKQKAKDTHNKTPHWSYSGDTGPKHWGDLCPDWAIAKNGKEQSPIDIANASEKDLPLIEFNYQPTRVNIINNGHAIQVNCDKGSIIKVDGQTYLLEQFHFHAPSEHTIGGKLSAMEMHLVHKSAQGKLAVVGVIINSGAVNKAYEPVWKHMPAKAGKEIQHEDKVNTSNLLPTKRSYYSYPGSLTTPPCSEGVKWLVLAEPVKLSPEQLTAFTKIYSGNNRPVQPLNNRKILKSK